MYSITTLNILMILCNSVTGPICAKYYTSQILLVL